MVKAIMQNLLYTIYGSNIGPLKGLHLCMAELIKLYDNFCKSC